MLEYIERNSLIEFANNQKDKTLNANDIARFPAANVVKVVRCRDCKFNHLVQPNGTVHCSRESINGVGTAFRKADDFCSYGKRRGKEE